MKDNNPKILIDSSSPEERRGFLKKLGAFATSIAALGGFTNLKAKNTFSGKELSFAASPEAYIGSITMFGGNFPPREWAFCHGQLLSISDYNALFAILGCTFGGDCRTSLGLPDFRGRVPIGEGTGPGLPTFILGQRIGLSTTHTLHILELPPHTHTAQIVKAPAYTGRVNPQALNGRGTRVENPSNKYLASSSGVEIFSESTDVVMGESLVAITPDGDPPYGQVDVSTTGSGRAFSIMQPSTVVNYIICLNGVFPPRN